MISLTKFDGETFIVNVFHIHKVEARHETRIVFINGQTQLIKETREEVQAKVEEYFKRIFKGGLTLTDTNSKESDL